MLNKRKKKAKRRTSQQSRPSLGDSSNRGRRADLGDDFEHTDILAGKGHGLYAPGTRTPFPQTTYIKEEYERLEPIKLGVAGKSIVAKMKERGYDVPAPVSMDFHHGCTFHYAGPNQTAAPQCAPRPSQAGTDKAHQPFLGFQ